MSSKPKNLGQHFLQDKNILKKEAKIAKPRGKVVLEIGAGDGRLTEEILRFKPKFIFAVEVDEKLVHEFYKNCCKDNDNIILMQGDFLELELPQFEVVVGNIPYYISSDIIFRLAESYFQRAVLVVQKEFAERMVATPGTKKYGRLSVTSQLAFDVKLVQKIPKHLFSPPPKVDSALILLKPAKHERLTQFQENVIRALFSHKNKTVRNALLDSKKFEKKKIMEISPELLKQRPVKLSKEKVLEVAKLLE